MTLPSPPPQPVSPDLESALAAVELHLARLGEALRERDGDDIDREATALYRSLAGAVQVFAQAARRGGVPQHLRQRLALASGQVAAQRESLARATAALDRAIDVLMPGTLPGAVYSAAGSPDRAPMGSAQA